MSRDTTVIAFRQPEAIDAPLSELAREGARRMLAQVPIAEPDCFVAMWKDFKLPDAATAWCVMAMGRSAQSRPGSGLSRSVAPRCAIGARWARGEKSALPRRSCRSGRGGRTLLMRCCRSSTCVGCRPATSRSTALLGEDAPNCAERSNGRACAPRRGALAATTPSNQRAAVRTSANVNRRQFAHELTALLAFRHAARSCARRAGDGQHIGSDRPSAT